MIAKRFQPKSKTSLFSNLFTSDKQKPLKTVYKKQKKTTKTTINTDAQQLKIDQILDKISKSGYETLTKDEKEFLFSVGKK